MTDTRPRSSSMIGMVSEAANCDIVTAMAYIVGFASATLTDDEIAEMVESARLMRV